MNGNYNYVSSISYGEVSLPTPLYTSLRFSLPLLFLSLSLFLPTSLLFLPYKCLLPLFSTTPTTTQFKEEEESFDQLFFSYPSYLFSNPFLSPSYTLSPPSTTTDKAPDSVPSMYIHTHIYIHTYNIASQAKPSQPIYLSTHPSILRINHLQARIRRRIR
jgi:hypothetical protein